MDTYEDTGSKETRIVSPEGWIKEWCYPAKPKITLIYQYNMAEGVRLILSQAFQVLSSSKCKTLRRRLPRKQGVPGTTVKHNAKVQAAGGRLCLHTFYAIRSGAPAKAGVFEKPDH
jgi:hypothetical protein